MAFPITFNIFRGDWDTNTASSTDTGVQYIQGNVVIHNGDLWMYVSSTAGNSSAPDETNAAWDLISGSGGGPTPTPMEHFTLTLAGTGIGGSFPNYHIAQDSTATTHTTVTATVGVSGTGFTYDGFTRTNVTGIAGNLPTVPQAASAPTNTFSFGLDITQAGTQTVSVGIESTANSASLPIHTITANIQIVAPAARWYTGASTSVPTALTDLTDNGPYSSGVTATIPALTNGEAYVLLPTGSYTFKTGAFFLDTPSTQTQTFAPGYTLYQLSSNDYNGDGTLILEVTDG